MTDWKPFDYERKAETKPPHGDLVWVYGVMPGGETDVDLGFFDGFTFCMWNGTDDCSIEYWAEITYPAEPGTRSSTSEGVHNTIRGNVAPESSVIQAGNITTGISIGGTQ